MLKRFTAPALGVLAFAVALPALAQSPPQQQMCMRLEAQLAALDQQQPGQGPNRAAEDAYNQQRAELDRTLARSRGMGCGRTFLFGPRPPAECRGLEAQINRLKQNLDRIGADLERGRGNDGAQDARRRDLLANLSSYQCGPQYQAAVPPPQPQRQGGLFGLLFGGRERTREAYPDQAPMAVPSVSTYRTVCVRTCDGFFFPVSYQTVPGRFGQDENMCRRTCPGTQAELFSYPNPGGSIEQATSVTGQPYTDLPNAFKYQKEFVKDCSCKPANMSWVEALAGAEDGTVQRGDIVVDEERARAMSQPQGENTRATPAEAARAAQDSARSVTTDGIIEGSPQGDQQSADPMAPPEQYAYPPQQAAPQQNAFPEPPPVYIPPPPPPPPVYAPPARRPQPPPNNLPQFR